MAGAASSVALAPRDQLTRRRLPFLAVPSVRVAGYQSAPHRTSCALRQSPAADPAPLRQTPRRTRRPLPLRRPPPSPSPRRRRPLPLPLLGAAPAPLAPTHAAPPPAPSHAVLSVGSQPRHPAPRRSCLGPAAGGRAAAFLAPRRREWPLPEALALSFIVLVAADGPPCRRPCPSGRTENKILRDSQSIGRGGGGAMMDIVNAGTYH